MKSVSENSQGNAKAADDEPSASGWQYEVADESASPDLAPAVGKNLRRLRVQRGLSLERLAKASGVSRAMLGQIELAQSTPTINVLWKVARALNVAFSALISGEKGHEVRVLRASQSKRLASHDGRFVSRALFPFDEPRRVEFYELTLAPGCVESAEPHPPGTMENLIVSRGAATIEVGNQAHPLELGDAIVFEADAPHCYRNPSAEVAVLYLVMTYAERVG